MTITGTDFRPRKKGGPRDARSYRGARRNDGHGGVWQGIKPTLRKVWRFERIRRDGKPYCRYTGEKLRELRRTRR